MALLASLSATLFVGLGIFFVNYRLNRPNRTVEITQELTRLQEELDRFPLEEFPDERSKLVIKLDNLEKEMIIERRQEISLWVSWVGLLTCGVILPFLGSLFISDNLENILEIRIIIGYSMLLVAGLVIWTVKRVNDALKEPNLVGKGDNYILAPIPPFISLSLVVLYIILVFWCVSILAGWIQSEFWLVD